MVISTGSVAAGGATGRAVLTSGGSLLPPAGALAAFGMPGPYVWDATTARRIPAVGRAVSLYGGMVKQMPIDVYRNGESLPRPALLESPDPAPVWPRSRFLQCCIEDYLLSGNNVCYVTARGVDGWPLAIRYLPINWVYISWMPPTIDAPAGDLIYTFMGETLRTEDVIHVARGVDRWYPVRGVGVVEEHLSTLDRAAQEEEYERSTLSGAAVPSVAIITPQATLDQDIADQAKESWMEKYAGPVRVPAILPNGTQVIPLAWSPADAQMVEARKMTIVDIANLFNLDSYWLGSAVQGMTYKTAAPQYQQILRTSIEPVIVDFEQVWSDTWVPRGQTVRFDRNKLLAEDLPTTALALSQLVAARIVTPSAAWQILLGEPLPSVDNEPGEAPPSTTPPGTTPPSTEPPAEPPPNAEEEA